MGNFETAYAKTAQWEGYYSNRKADRGGITYAGISRKYHPNWPGWEIVDRKPRKHNEHIVELDIMVRNFYKRYFWDLIRASEICNDKVAGFLYDFYVHSGPNASKAVQKIVGVPVDGIIGPKTIQAINNYENGLFQKLKMERIAFVNGIVARDPGQADNLGGWLNRISSFT